MNQFEIKSAFTADEAGTITGLAWPFGSPDKYGDTIQRGAFANVKMPLPMLFGHDPDWVIGTWDEAAETDRGLELKGRLMVNELLLARETHALVKRGALSGLSIGYSTKASRFRQGGGREITALDLAECSIVSIPSHSRAGIYSLKSDNDVLYVAELLRSTAAILCR